MTPIALTIAGSDPSGGAGIQADLKTFHQFGVYGTSVLTLVTAQNTVEARDVEYLSASFVLTQIDSLLADLPPNAAKTGALGTREVVEAVAQRAARFRFPLVVDPVMISKHGAVLMSEDAKAALAGKLMPSVYLLTPNVHEAMALSGLDYFGPKSIEEAARAIVELGAKNVLIKGGHLADSAVDVLYAEGKFHEFPANRIDTRHTHGTGCTYSAAITAELAKGRSLLESVSSAKSYITRAIETNPGLGRGNGPVNHWAQA